MCFIFFTENNEPIVEFYRALTLGPRSKGSDYLSAILLAFNDDDIIEDVKARCVEFLDFLIA